MKAVVITRPGPPEVLQVLEWPTPEPAPGQVRIRTRFAGVNFADTMARVGLYPDAPKPPSVIGYEVSGTVDKLGDGVDPARYPHGARAFGMTMFGGYAEYACLPADAVRLTPDGMSDEEAAALPVTYVTAYHMLCYLTVVRPGDRVLIHAAAGGVGISAIQICKAAGAEIFGTASASKHDFLRGQGVHHCIDYNSEDFLSKVLELTRGEGVDIVLDALGGSALKKSYACLRPAGRLFTFGFSRAGHGDKRRMLKVVGEFLRIPRFAPLKLMDDNRSVLGVNMNHMAARPELMGREFDGLVDLYKQGAIRPRVDKVFPFAETGEAHRFLQQRKNVGKVLIQAP